MINDELIAYIQAQLRKNILKDTVVSKLTNVGWHLDDINEAFQKLTPSKIVENTTTLSKDPDIYRELPEKTEPEAIDLTDAVSASDTQTTPPIIESEPIKTIFSSSYSEANSQNITTPYYIPNNVTPGEKNITKKEEDHEPNINFGIMRPKVMQVPPSQIPTPSSVPTSIPIDKPKPAYFSEEFLPELKSKISNNTPEIKVDNIIQSKVKASEIIPQNAILHSYPQILSSSKEKSLGIPDGKRRIFIKTLIIILIISFVSGVIFAFTKNYIKLPSINFSFIKKDPKNLLINAPAILSDLKSYKIETVVTISTPSFADITNGLVSGESTPSQERDTISVYAQGSVNNTNKSSPNFNYSANIKSSLLKNNISYGLRYISDQTFITMPSLVDFLGSNAPGENTISTDKTQISTLTRLLPENIQPITEKVNINKLLSTILPSYVTSETEAVFKEFVTTASVIEKDSEKVRDIDTYHYALTSDKQSTKKFLNSFASIFTQNLNVDDSTYLNDIFGSTNIDTLEVWIGKDDGNIHQYELTLTTPLSKLLRLEDKGIAGNTVSFNWTTTYYDFNLGNSIEIPKNSITMSEYIKSTEDMKVKDLIYSFKPLANNFRNSTGNFGKRTNPNGSCTNPNPGSLFSPTGHPAVANNAVGNIASTVNNILNITNGALSCYSTSDAWAVAAPLISDPVLSSCSDSTGASKTINTKLTGTLCK